MAPRTRRDLAHSFALCYYVNLFFGGVTKLVR